MTVQLIGPDSALALILADEIKRTRDCVLAVAYLDDAGVNKLLPALKKRLQASPSFRLRLVFRSSDYAASPTALRALRKLAPASRPDAVRLRYSRHWKFHAKAFGFRAAKDAAPNVIIGSANLLGGALGFQSGELSVALMRSRAAEEAWLTLERFFEEGLDVTPGWLSKYQHAFEEVEKKRKALKKAIDSHPKPKQPGETAASASIPERLFVSGMGTMSDQRSRELQAAAEEDGEPLVGTYLEYETEAEARALPTNDVIMAVVFDDTEHHVLDSVRLLRCDPYRRVRGSLAGRGALISPHRIVRKSTRTFSKKQREAIEAHLRKLGLLDWLRKQRGAYVDKKTRTALLEAFASVEWKPAIEALGANAAAAAPPANKKARA